MPPLAARTSRPATDLATPGAGLDPIPAHGAVREPECAGGLSVVIPGKEAALDDLSQPGIERGQLEQRIIDLDHGLVGCGAEFRSFVQGNVGDAAAALARHSVTGVIHEDVPHGEGARPQEVLVVVERGEVFQLEIGFADQGGGLQRDAGTNPHAFTPRNAPQVLIREGNELRGHVLRAGRGPQIVLYGDLALDIAGHSASPGGPGGCATMARTYRLAMFSS